MKFIAIGIISLLAAIDATAVRSTWTMTASVFFFTGSGCSATASPSVYTTDISNPIQHGKDRGKDRNNVDSRCVTLPFAGNAVQTKPLGQSCAVNAWSKPGCKGLWTAINNESCLVFPFVSFEYTCPQL